MKSKWAKEKTITKIKKRKTDFEEHFHNEKNIFLGHTDRIKEYFITKALKEVHLEWSDLLSN